MSADLVAAAADALVGAFTVELAHIPPPGPWTANARCRTLPKSVFFPERGDAYDHAVEVCRRCPVRLDCLDYAVPYQQLTGVWGGTTGAERRRLRARRPPETTPPAKPVRRVTQPGALYATLEQLTEHPGRWALVAGYPSPHSAAATASLYRNGYRPVPAGRWQFEGRVNEEGGSDLYAKWEGAA